MWNTARYVRDCTGTSPVLDSVDMEQQFALKYIDRFVAIRVKV
jgi:hypothetical protein